MRTRSVRLVLTAVFLSSAMWAVVRYTLAGAPAPATTSSATRPAKEMTLELGEKVTMKLLEIPAGKFLMGSPATEKGHDGHEIQHEVTISKPFYMGVTHVTVDQFAAFVKESGYKTNAEKNGWSTGFSIKDGQSDGKAIYGASWRNPSFEQQGDHPVVQVNWHDAQAFCAWLSKKSGKKVGLPTEAQWEYACRAGTKTAYPWGENPEDGKGWANLADQSLHKMIPKTDAGWKFHDWDDGFVFTSPVGSFKANAFGLYDMIGNAGQWCEDRWGDYEKGAATDPTGPDSGRLRVLRGGSWYYVGGYRSAAHTPPADPEFQTVCYGFRVVVAGGN